tara:strand:- start:108 stop:680 length:573 start_codon:yes stop_codon:yes gene_type:complete
LAIAIRSSLGSPDFYLHSGEPGATPPPNHTINGILLTTGEACQQEEQYFKNGFGTMNSSDSDTLEASKWENYVLPRRTTLLETTPLLKERMRHFLEEVRASWLAISMFLVAGLLFVSAATGELGLAKGLSLESELAEINQASFHMMQEIDQTREQIRKIEEEDLALENLARRRLHMVRDGDTLYRIGTKN